MCDVRLNLLRALVCISLMTLLSCSKLSDVGEQEEPAPKAIATSIGQEFTTDSSGNATMTVRAGADVILTGKESEKGTDDTGVPLINFQWVQSSTDAVQVQLISRTANTVTFTAPQVTQDTALHFTLTVSDAKGTADTAQATVTVKNIRDPDHFLQYLGVPDTFSVELTTATGAGIAPVTEAVATELLPVTVTMTKWVTFRDRNQPDGSVTNQTVKVGSPVVVNTGWTKRLGAGTDCSSPTNPNKQNPTIQLPLPRLSLDDLLAEPVSGFADAVVLSDVLEPADIDTASVAVRLEVNTSATASPRLCVNNGTVASPSGVDIEVESLLASAEPRDSKLAAQAYYDAIDPAGVKTTLNNWLSANGFNPNVKGWDADAHAIYTNNYDLGFGRDMYMKTGNCQSGTTTLPLDQRIGTCDIAAVVVNYSGVEAAAKGLNPIVAVAMEYSAPPSGGPRYVKFYTYTPDTRTGEYKQVLSVNLDRRGEQYLPQACVVCHGGTPKKLVSGAYPDDGNVDATFLPWDLDSFLYSDTDPGFSRKTHDAALRTQYTRTAQQEQFKLLNTGAYLTYHDGVNSGNLAGRYALAKELVQGWYDDASLSRATFNSAFVPLGWRSTGIDGVAGNSDDNPADSASIYTDVFARNCRACHVMQLPVSAGDPHTSNACRADATVANTTNQVVMGCYWQFANAQRLVERLSENRMPFARRTSDRMWASSGTMAGKTLQDHFNSDEFARFKAKKVVTTPGVPNVCIDAISSLDRNQWLSLSSTPDGCGSRFLSNARWSLQSVPSLSTAALVGSDTENPRFFLDKQGDYSIRLTDSSGATADTTVSVEVKAPVAASGSLEIPLIASTGTSTIDVRTQLLGPPTFSSRDPVVAIANLVVDSDLTVVTSGTNSALSSTQMQITTTATAARTIRYQLIDVDGDLSPNQGTITVTGSAGLSISAIPIQDVIPNQTGKTISIGNGIAAGGYITNPNQRPLTFTFWVNGQASSATSISTSLRRTLTFSSNWYPTGTADATKTQTRAFGLVRLVDAATGQFSYDAPRQALTHSSDGSVQVGPLDGFSFQACTDQGSCVIGQVQVGIRATQSISGLKTLLTGTSNTSDSSGCSNCHGAGQGNLIINASDDDRVFHCRLRGIADGDGEVGYINLTTSTSSLLYTKPNGGTGHQMRTGALTAIQNWINQGAYNTTGNEANQSCP